MRKKNQVKDYAKCNLGQYFRLTSKPFSQVRYSTGEGSAGIDRTLLQGSDGCIIAGWTGWQKDIFGNLRDGSLYYQHVRIRY